MPSKVRTIPEPDETTAGVHFEVYTGPPPRVSVAYAGDAATWEGDDVPAVLRAQVAAAMRTALSLVKSGWGY